MIERMWRDHRIGEWPAAVTATIKTIPGWLKTAYRDPWPDRRVHRYLSDDDRSRVIRMLEEDTDSSADAERLRKEGATHSRLSDGIPSIATCSPRTADVRLDGAAWWMGCRPALARSLDRLTVL
jgi:hypothetical protein